MPKYAHLKLDGHCLFLERTSAWTKTFINILPKLQFMDLPKVPTGFKVHGELWAPGVKASSIKTLINDASPQLRFTAWAVEGLALDTPLPSLVQWCAQHGFDFAPFWQFGYQPAILPEDAEGWVFKDGNLLNFQKWKPVKTLDAVVTDIKPGKGKYLGQVGALILSVEGQEVANVSGMSDEERAAMGEHNIGQVVEVAYQYVGSKGRLRHPRFIRFRDDKLPDQCLLSQDPDLCSSSS